MVSDMIYTDHYKVLNTVSENKNCTVPTKWTKKNLEKIDLINLKAAYSLQLDVQHD